MTFLQQRRSKTLRAARPILETMLTQQLAVLGYQIFSIHPCTIRYVWVKESTDELGYAHYHVLLLVNRDRFHCLGHFNSDKTNLFSRIQKAWASALRMNLSNVKAAVHFPHNCMYHLDINSGTFNESYSPLFYRVSYMAKISTKHYGNRNRAFGCSRK